MALTDEEKAHLAKLKTEADKLKNNQDKVLQLKEGLRQQKFAEDAATKAQDKRIADEERRGKSATARAALNDPRPEGHGLPRLTKIEGQASYIEWNTSMMEIFAAANLLSQVLMHDEVFSRGLKFVWNISAGQTDTGKAIEQLPELVGQKIKGKLLDIGWMKDTEIAYTMSVDNTGKLTTVATKNGQPFAQNEKDLFDSGAIAWLEQEKKCTFDPDTGILKDESGKEMTPDALKKLNVDDEKGFRAFFQGKYDMNVEETPSPRP